MSFYCPPDIVKPKSKSSPFSCFFDYINKSRCREIQRRLFYFVFYDGILKYILEKYKYMC